MLLQGCPFRKEVPRGLGEQSGGWGISVGNAPGKLKLHKGYREASPESSMLSHKICRFKHPRDP